MINVLSYFDPPPPQPRGPTCPDYGLARPGVSPVQRQSSSVSWLSVMAETGLELIRHTGALEHYELFVKGCESE